MRVGAKTSCNNLLHSENQLTVCGLGRRNHDDDFRKRMVLLVQMFDEVQRSIEEPLRHHQGHLSLGGIPRRVQLGAVNDVFGTEVPRDQVRGRVVVNDRRELGRRRAGGKKRSERMSPRSVDTSTSSVGAAQASP